MMVHIYCNQTFENHFPAHFSDVYLKHLPAHRLNTNVFAYTNDKRRDVTFDRDNEINAQLRLFKKEKAFFLKLLKTLFVSAAFAVDIMKSRNQKDVVIMHNDAMAAILPLLVCKLMKKRFIFRVTHLIPEDYLKRGGLKNIAVYVFAARVRSIIMYLSDVNIFMSNAMFNVLIGRRCDIVLPSMVPMIITEQLQDVGLPTNVHDWLESTKDTLKLIYIGTLDTSRESIRMLDLVKCLKSRGVATTLSIFGVNNLETDTAVISEVINEKSLRSDVQLFSPLDYKALIRVFKSVDLGLCLFPEDKVLMCNSPIKTLDYINNGLPAVVSYNPDSKDVIANTRFGIAFDGDLGTLAEKIVELDMQELAINAGTAREWVRRNRSCEVATRCILDIIRK